MPRGRLIEFRPGVFAREGDQVVAPGGIIWTFCRVLAVGTRPREVWLWSNRRNQDEPPAWLRSLPVGDTGNHMRRRPRSSGWPGEHA